MGNVAALNKRCTEVLWIWPPRSKLHFALRFLFLKATSAVGGRAKRGQRVASHQQVMIDPLGAKLVAGNR